MAAPSCIKDSLYTCIINRDKTLIQIPVDLNSLGRVSVRVQWGKFILISLFLTLSPTVLVGCGTQKSTATAKTTSDITRSDQADYHAAGPLV